MDFNQIAVFIKVVQAGSFSAAARQLSLPVSTVSHRVAMLEKRLGITLLQRTTRRLHLTEAGQIYFQHASAGLGQLLDAEAAIKVVAAEPCGLLRVSVLPDLGEQLLASILLEIRDRWPRLQVELLLIHRRMDLVSEGVDAAIRAGELEDSSLVARKVGTARWAVFTSPGYLATTPAPETPEQLCQHPCLQFTPMGKTAWAFSRGAQHVTVPVGQQIVVNNIGLVMNMVLAGGGVALLPDYLCRQACQEGRLVRLLPQWQAKQDPIHLVYPRQQFVSPGLRAFLDIAGKTLKTWLA